MKHLLITSGGLGDQIHYSCLIAAIKKNEPEAHITVFCHPEQSFIYNYDPNVSVVSSDLNGARFDIGYNYAIRKDLCDIFDDVPIKERIGFIKTKHGIGSSNQIARELLKIAILRKRTTTSFSEWICNIAGLEWQHPYFSINPLIQLNKTSDVVLQYGTRKLEKNLPHKFYEDCIESISSKIVVTGYKDQEENIKKLYKKYKNIDILIGKTFSDLHKTAYLLKNAKVLISPDTSVVHVGIGVGTAKVIVISNGYDRGFALTEKFNGLQILKVKNMKDAKVNEVIQCLKNGGL